MKSFVFIWATLFPDRGRMQVTRRPDGNKDMLPGNSADEDCRRMDVDQVCFKAGEEAHSVAPAICVSSFHSRKKAVQLMFLLIYFT